MPLSMQWELVHLFEDRIQSFQASILQVQHRYCQMAMSWQVVIRHWSTWRSSPPQPLQDSISPTPTSKFFYHNVNVLGTPCPYNTQCSVGLSQWQQEEDNWGGVPLFPLDPVVLMSTPPSLYIPSKMFCLISSSFHIQPFYSLLYFIC